MYYIFTLSTLGQIKEFLKSDFLEFLKECDIRRLVPSLKAHNVIDYDEIWRTEYGGGRREANLRLYEMLCRDISTQKLSALSHCLREDNTQPVHRLLADKISAFLGTTFSYLLSAFFTLQFLM